MGEQNLVPAGASELKRVAMEKRVFITGGASGLGKARARRYARDGAARAENVILPHRDGAAAWFGKRFLPNSVYHSLFHRSVERMMQPK